MTEILFYITEQAGEGVQTALARRIAEKAWRQSRRIYVHCRDDAHARDVDAAFWAQPATGFLPHDLAGAPVAGTPVAGTPVVVGHGDDPGDHHDVLINLAPEVPDFATRFQRVAEMITGDGPLREAGRARFRFYRDRGFQIQSHRL
ncbi:MAG: DNA polymerase III subunit chi [Alloalcanivorax venustensis]|uniref:DNA polymerase III, chi subunit n=1 Tax=uncultured Oceanospirillales bacterium HF4000_13G19 TaxID=710745 RepID=E0XVK9_9GAMM|nr:DNA polymerase III, chi subunit [uncultured Oceanospirillales bacterium HF4000_13G19]QVL42335.1 MAG: DNA polymerase III subunit chi [Alcanivorax sp.]